MNGNEIKQRMERDYKRNKADFEKLLIKYDKTTENRERIEIAKKINFLSDLISLIEGW